jgi:glycine/D-amino acid oxidase-like deaminating enzyme
MTGTPSRSLRAYHDDEDTGCWSAARDLTGADEAHATRYEVLEQFAREHFDVIDVSFRWSTQDGMPSDKLPYIGPDIPRSSHLFVAAGFQKWGMTSA